MKSILVFSWPYNLIYLAMALGLVLIDRPMRRRSRGLPRTQDRSSVRVINVGAGGGAVIAMVLAILLPAAAMPAPRLAFWLGAALILGGGLIRFLALRALGESFTAIVHVVPGQGVVERGPYRWVRHPAYTAAIASLVGIGLTLGNWVSLGLLFLIALVVYSYRATVEEAALVATLGRQYQEYQRRTWRFVPFFY